MGHDISYWSKIYSNSTNSLCEGSLKVFSDFVNKLKGVEVHVARWVGGATGDAKSEVLSHVSILNRLDDNSLKRSREVGELDVVVKLCPLSKTTSPGEDRSDRVGRCLFALLVLAVMASDSAMSSLSFE